MFTFPQTLQKLLSTYSRVSLVLPTLIQTTAAVFYLIVWNFRSFVSPPVPPAEQGGLF